MNDHDDVFDALRPLTGPSTAAEGTMLTADVDAMVATFTIVREPPMQKTSSSRRKSIATMLAAGVIGFGGVAAAGPSGLDVLNTAPPATSTTTIAPDPTAPSTAPTTTEAPPPESSTTTVAAPTTADPTIKAEPPATDAPDSPDTELIDAGTAVLVDDPATAFDETECADGNHGKTVSSVAHATEGPNKGQTVREAAQSSCGKKIKEKADGEIDDEIDDETDDEIDDETDDEIDDEIDDETDKKIKDRGPKRNDAGSATTADTEKSSTSRGNGNSQDKSNGNGKSKNKGK